MMVPCGWGGYTDGKQLTWTRKEYVLKEDEEAVVWVSPKLSHGDFFFNIVEWIIIAMKLVMCLV